MGSSKQPPAPIIVLTPGRGRVLRKNAVAAPEEPRIAPKPSDRFEEGVAYAVARGLTWPDEEIPAATIELALRAAETVLGDTLAEDADRARALVQRAIEQLNPRNGAVVGVHPAGVDALRAVLPPNIELRAMPELLPGECIVHSPEGAIDGRIQVRSEQLRQALLKGLRDRS